MRRFGWLNLTWLEIVGISATVMLVLVFISPLLMHRHHGSPAATCLNQQRQLAVGILAYAQDAQETLPLPYAWVSASGLVSDPLVFRCPSSRDHGTPNAPNYGMNAGLYIRNLKTGRMTGVKFEDIADPSKIELTVDIAGPSPLHPGTASVPNPFPGTYTVTGFTGPGANAAFWHPEDEGINCSYADGHVASVRKRDLEKMPATKFSLPR